MDGQDKKSDSFDIYEDLTDFDLGKKVEQLEQEKQDLQLHIESQNAKQKILEDTIEDLKQTNETLLENISSLFKTAEAELKRKNKLIDDLRRERDDTAFRRNKNKFNANIRNEVAPKIETPVSNSAENVFQQRMNGLEIYRIPKKSVQTVENVNNVEISDKNEIPKRSESDDILNNFNEGFDRKLCKNEGSFDKIEEIDRNIPNQDKNKFNRGINEDDGEDWDRTERKRCHRIRSKDRDSRSSDLKSCDKRRFDQDGNKDQGSCDENKFDRLKEEEQVSCDRSRFDRRKNEDQCSKFDRKRKRDQSGDRSKVDIGRNRDRSSDRGRNRDRSSERARNRDKSSERGRNRDQSSERGRNRDQSSDRGRNRDQSSDRGRNRDKSSDRSKIDRGRNNSSDRKNEYQDNNDRNYLKRKLNDNHDIGERRRYNDQLSSDHRGNFNNYNRRKSMDERNVDRRGNSSKFNRRKSVDQRGFDRRRIEDHRDFDRRNEDDWEGYNRRIEDKRGFGNIFEDERGFGNRFEDERGFDNRIEDERVSNRRIEDDWGFDKKIEDGRVFDRKTEDERGFNRRIEDNKAFNGRIEGARDFNNRIGDERVFDRKTEDDEGSNRKIEDERGFNRRIEDERGFERRNEDERVFDRRFDDERGFDNKSEDERVFDRRIEDERRFDRRIKDDRGSKDDRGFDRRNEAVDNFLRYDDGRNDPYTMQDMGINENDLHIRTNHHNKKKASEPKKKLKAVDKIERELSNKIQQSSKPTKNYFTNHLDNILDSLQKNINEKVNSDDDLNYHIQLRDSKDKQKQEFQEGIVVDEYLPIKKSKKKKKDKKRKKDKNIEVPIDFENISEDSFLVSIKTKENQKISSFFQEEIKPKKKHKPKINKAEIESYTPIKKHPAFEKTDIEDTALIQSSKKRLQLKEEIVQIKNDSTIHPEVITTKAKEDIVTVIKKSTTSPKVNTTKEKEDFEDTPPINSCKNKLQPGEDIVPRKNNNTTSPEVITAKAKEDIEDTAPIKLSKNKLKPKEDIDTRKNKSTTSPEVITAKAKENIEDTAPIISSKNKLKPKEDIHTRKNKSTTSTEVIIVRAKEDLEDTALIISSKNKLQPKEHIVQRQQKSTISPKVITVRAKEDFKDTAPINSFKNAQQPKEDIVPRKNKSTKSPAKEVTRKNKSTAHLEVITTEAKEDLTEEPLLDNCVVDETQPEELNIFDEIMLAQENRLKDLDKLLETKILATKKEKKQEIHRNPEIPHLLDNNKIVIVSDIILQSPRVEKDTKPSASKKNILLERYTAEERQTTAKKQIVSETKKQDNLEEKISEIRKRKAEKPKLDPPKKRKLNEIDEIEYKLELIHGKENVQTTKEVEIEKVEIESIQEDKKVRKSRSGGKVIKTATRPKRRNIKDATKEDKTNTDNFEIQKTESSLVSIPSVSPKPQAIKSEDIPVARPKRKNSKDGSKEEKNKTHNSESKKMESSLVSIPSVSPESQAIKTEDISVARPKRKNSKDGSKEEKIKTHNSETKKIESSLVGIPPVSPIPLAIKTEDISVARPKRKNSKDATKEDKSKTDNLETQKTESSLISIPSVSPIPQTMKTEEIPFARPKRKNSKDATKEDKTNTDNFETQKTESSMVGIPSVSPIPLAIKTEDIPVTRPKRKNSKDVNKEDKTKTDNSETKKTESMISMPSILHIPQVSNNSKEEKTTDNIETKKTESSLVSMPSISPVPQARARKRITPTPVKETPVCSFKNILEKNKSNTKIFSKNIVMDNTLNLTDEGEIPILHLEDNHFNNMEDATNKTFDGTIFKLIDDMNVSSFDCDISKLDVNKESPVPEDNLTFRNVVDKDTDPPRVTPTNNTVAGSTKIVDSKDNQLTVTDNLDKTNQTPVKSINEPAPRVFKRRCRMICITKRQSTK